MRRLLFRSGRGTQDFYTPEEDALIARHWSALPLRRLAVELRRSEASVSHHTRRLVRAGTLDPTRQWKRCWTAAEDDAIRDRYGTLPDAALGRRLRRTPNAVGDRAFLLGVRRKDQHLTATDIARLLGVDEHRVLRLAESGRLRLARAPFGALNRRWRVCTQAAFERFLRRHPTAYQWQRIVDEPWRSIGRRAWSRADLLTTQEVAALKGCSSDWVVRHCRSGALGSVRAGWHGGTGQYLIRRADAEAWPVRGMGGAPVLLRPVGKRPKQREPRARAVRMQPVSWRNVS